MLREKLKHQVTFWIYCSFSKNKQVCIYPPFLPDHIQKSAPIGLPRNLCSFWTAKLCANDAPPQEDDAEGAYASKKEADYLDLATLR